MGTIDTGAAEGGRGHVPVLVRQVLELLAPRPGETLLDATVGSAGHSLAVAELVGPEGCIVGIDRDETAIERARGALADAGPRVCLCQANFSETERVLDECGTDTVDMAILDLGVSSNQLDDPSRGYAFKATGPLDMRADRRQDLTAEALVNDSDESDLADIIFRFGEEREARRIAREIVRARAKERIRTTTELAKLIARAKRERRGRIHPATRVFQALRIAVNRELESLEAGLIAVWKRMAPGGRMAVISFHSLEDRIVKGFFRKRRADESAEVLTKKPVCASKRERKRNPRSRSAKLRVLRRPVPANDEGSAT
jgi:16S rRNA (cytosine1402-N4)-methyltransferase